MRATTATRLLAGAVLTLSLTTACRAEQQDPAVSLRHAVDRTIETGSVRFRGRVVPSSGEPVAIAGVTSFTTQAATVSATAAEGPPEHSAEVRMAADRAWVRAPGTSEWVGVVRHPEFDNGAGSWRVLLDRVRKASEVTRAGKGSLRGRLPEGTVAVSLDSAGRINGLFLAIAGGSVELNLYDFGAEVEAGSSP